MKVSIEKANAGALDLMGRVLRNQGSIASEYPLVFREDLPGRLVTLSEGGAVRSACAIVERDLRIGDARVRLGLIGSVSTDPAWRGRGFASRVLKAAEKELAEHGATFSMLWADEPGFYSSHGYREVGAELDYVISAELAPHLPASDGVRPARSTDLACVHSLYLEHPERIERSESESRAMLSSPGIELFVLERDGDPVAYACLGRGFDLRDVVHEWGGATVDVLSVVRGLLEARRARGDDNDLFLMAPLTAAGAFAPLDRLGAPSVRGILGQAKVLDPHGVEALLANVAPEASCEVRSRAAGTSFRLRGRTGLAELDAPELLGLLFAPRGDRSEVEALERTLGASLAGLPLLPFVWGLDSI